MSSKFATQRVEELQGDVEGVRYIGEKDNPDFANSWVNFGAGTEPAAFYKDKFSRVWLSGLINDGTVGVGSPVFTLPAGYRPNFINNFSTIDGTGTPSGRLAVLADGSLEIRAGSNTFISLDGFSWRV